MTHYDPAPGILKRVFKSRRSVALAGILLLPTVMSSVILYVQRLPFPYLDDYKGLLAFCAHYVEAPSAGAKALQIATFEYNHYRLIIEHLAVAIDLALLHHVSFGFLTALGDSFPIGIFVLLWLSIRQQSTDAKLLRFLPVSLLLFSLTYGETLNWAEASLQNLPVVFFALAALVLLAPSPVSPTEGAAPPVSRMRFFLSCVSALLACCSSPNGFLLGPVGLLFLYFARSFRRGIVWCLSFVLPLWAYLYRPGAAEPYHFNVKQLFYFVAFLGCVFRWRMVAFSIGAGLLLFMFWAVRKGFSRQMPALAYMCLWVVLTGGLVGAIRSAIAARYSIYSIVMLICCYLFALNRFELDKSVSHEPSVIQAAREHFLKISIACSLLFYFQASWRTYIHLHARRVMVLSGLRYYRQDPKMNSPQADPLMDIAYPDEKPFELEILHRAEAEHFYTVPPAKELQP